MVAGSAGEAADRRYPRGFRSREIRSLRGGRLLLRPTLRLRIVGAVFTYPGAILALLGFLSVPKGGAVFLLVVAVGLALVALGRWARGSNVILDVERGTVTVGHPFFRKGWPITEVTALQMVDGGMQSPTDHRTRFRTWPLDLVLRGGGRYNLVSDSDQVATRETGQRLAGVLRVPFRSPPRSR